VNVCVCGGGKIERIGNGKWILAAPPPTKFSIFIPLSELTHKVGSERPQRAY